MPTWPKQSDVLAYRSPYGDPRGRNGLSNKTWEINNLVYVLPPFKMRMGDIKISRIRIHKYCAESLAAVLQQIWLAAGMKQATIKKWGMSEYGGSHNFRLMRGRAVLSMHSFGCAVDFDPERNGLGDVHGNFENVPAVRDAFAAQGWTWGGTWTRPDAMHWQAASIS